MSKYFFKFKFSFEIETESEDDAYKAAAKIFKKKTEFFHNASAWKDMIYRPPMDITTKEKVEI